MKAEPEPSGLGVVDCLSFDITAFDCEAERNRGKNKAGIPVCICPSATPNLTSQRDTTEQ